jgi:hypothetical protein
MQNHMIDGATYSQVDRFGYLATRTTRSEFTSPRLLLCFSTRNHTSLILASRIHQNVKKWGNRRANLYWERHLKAGHIPPDQ